MAFVKVWIQFVYDDDRVSEVFRLKPRSRGNSSPLAKSYWPQVWTFARIFQSLAPPPDVRKGSACRSLQAEPNPAMQPDLFKSPDGSRGIVNVRPSNTNNTHNSNSPNIVNMK